MSNQQDALRAGELPPTANTHEERAFDQGWLLAAQWAKRDDLPCDMDSPAYQAQRAAKLSALAASAPHEACAHDQRGLTIEGFKCIECDDTKRQIEVPNSWDVNALELARRFTQDTEPQRRANLQCAVIDAMRFAAPADHEAQQAGGEAVLWVSPDDLANPNFVGINAVRAGHEQYGKHYTLPLYTTPPSPDTAALVALIDRTLSDVVAKDEFNVSYASTETQQYVQALMQKFRALTAALRGNGSQGVGS